MRQLIKRMSSAFGWAKTPALGWAACAVLAAISAAFNASVYAGIMVFSTVITAACAMIYSARARAHLRYIERFTDEQRALVNMGRRARWILLTVKDKEGELYAASLAQILTDATPEGHDMLWDEPTAAGLFFMDPSGAYVRAEHGDAA